ncbi:MAG: methyl-accepting chemotaxis protein [Nitrospirae bacterium]|nr:MAG: methyl-accepting chemotaxis protein [Nitrospirota bacterium]
MGKKPYRRRNYFINRYFQGRFILLFVALASVGGIIAIGLFNYFAYKKLDDLLYSVHIPAKNINELISPDLIYANLFAFMFVLVVFFFAMNRLTIRITGPLYRIKKDLESIAGGDLSFNITLRYKDEFKDFAQELNVLVEKEREFFGRIKKEIEMIDRYTREAERYYPKHEMVALKVKHLKSHIRNIEESLEDIKV